MEALAVGHNAAVQIIETSAMRARQNASCIAGRIFNEIAKVRSRFRRICIARNLIERPFNKIKQCRRAATRHDWLAAYYLARATVPLAMLTDPHPRKRCACAILRRTS